MPEELAYSRPVDRPAAKSARTPAAARKAFLQQARDRWHQARDSDRKQEEREREDLKFYAGEQWPDDIKAARQGQNATNGLPPVPARPCLTINKLREPVRQVLNQERESDMGIEIVPSDDFGDLGQPISDEEITLREGLVRRIQRSSEASDARTWAFDRAVKAGRGYYGVQLRYVEGKTWDQEVGLLRFYDQRAVKLDPAHEQPDGSDADWAFVGAWVSLDEAKARWPKTAHGSPNRLTQATKDDLDSFIEDAPEWVRVDGETCAVYVVDYYYVERTARELLLLADESAVWADEYQGEDDQILDRRIVVERAIKFAKIDGLNDDVLEETDWPGPDLPIIKVLGEEQQPYDRERRVEGMVRSARDAQHSYNAMISQWVEMIALTPKPPEHVDPEAIEGYEDWYNQANTRTLPYLPYRTYDDNGRPFEKPSPSQRDTPIQAVAASVQLFDQGIQSTTVMHDPALGKVDPSLKSGRAITAIVARAQQGTSNYLDNLKRSMRYEGQILNNLLYPVYGQRPGRLVRILDAQGTAQTIPVGQPAQAQGQPYTLTPDVKFSVAIKVTRSYDTRRSEEADFLAQLLQAEPNLMAVYGDLFFKSLDVPGHEALAERAEIMLAPPVQHLLQAKRNGQPPLPVHIQQQMAQGAQVIQGLTAKLQELQHALDTKQVEQQGKLAIVQTQEAADLEKHREDNETKLAVAELGAKVDRLALFLEERGRLGAQAHDAAHEVGMAELAHAQSMEQGQQAAEQQAALATQQGANQPTNQTGA